MLNYHTSRHWSAQEDHATGDVLLSMLTKGWEVVTMERRDDQRPARLYDVTLKRDNEMLSLSVLDCPAALDLKASLN